MSLFTWITGPPRVQKVCRIAGLALFTAAFFLPACRDTENGGFLHAARFAGWECAWLSISMIFDRSAVLSPLFFAFLGGCINPLILIYLLIDVTKRFAKVQKALCAAVLLCMIATWAFFVLAHFVPLIGHMLWIAGALLILYPEFATLFRPNHNPTAADPPSNIARE
jgi:hypothetical protein